jgi:excisionase family DNA binding protein
MTDTTIQAIEHIVKTPGVLGGRARVADRRIPVWQIALLHNAQNVPAEEIAADYNLSIGQVFAALAYAADHPAEIEDEIASAESIANSAIRSEWQIRLEQSVNLRQRHAAEDQEMTTAEVAALYGLSDATVRQAILRGALPARKSGGTWLIRARDAKDRWGK